MRDVTRKRLTNFCAGCFVMGNGYGDWLASCWSFTLVIFLVPRHQAPKP